MQMNHKAKCVWTPGCLSRQALPPTSVLAVAMETVSPNCQCSFNVITAWLPAFGITAGQASRTIIHINHRLGAAFVAQGGRCRVFGILSG